LHYCRASYSGAVMMFFEMRCWGLGCTLLVSQIGTAVANALQ